MGQQIFDMNPTGDVGYAQATELARNVKKTFPKHSIQVWIDYERDRWIIAVSSDDLTDDDLCDLYKSSIYLWLIPTPEMLED